MATTLRPLALIPRLVVPLLPQHLRGLRTSAAWSYLVKIYYGNPDLHYEASHQPKLRTVEIGLHFEADELTNAELLGAFRSHKREVSRELPAARFEEWDKGWTRIWEPVVYGRFDEALAQDLAGRLARYITLLEPILRSELPRHVPWDLAPTRPGRNAAARPRSRLHTLRTP